MSAFGTDNERLNYEPKYANLAINAILTVAFLAAGLFLLREYISTLGTGYPDAYAIFLICVCFAAPVIVNVSTLPHYRRIGMNKKFLYVNDEPYRWELVALGEDQAVTKKLKLYYAVTVARRTEENFTVLIFDNEEQREPARKLRINSAIYADYSRMREEIANRAKHDISRGET
jgi:hypothetical protein